MLPAETAEMRKRLLTLAEPSEKAEATLKTYRMFAYGEISLHYTTDSIHFVNMFYI
jgi:hypothetical protein